MKILIAYSTKTGTCAECAKMLSDALPHAEVCLADLAKESPDPRLFDIAVIGGSVRFEKLSGALNAFLSLWKDALTEKPLGLFLCCGFPEEADRYFEKFFPADLRSHAFSVLCFGGDLKPKEAGWIDRLLLRFFRDRIRESEIDDGEFTPTLPAILPENIGKMASFIRKEAERL